MKQLFKIFLYIIVYSIMPVAMASGLDFKGIETDVSDTIINGKRFIVMIAFAGAVLSYLVTRRAAVVAGFVLLILFAAKGLDIALAYVG